MKKILPVILVMGILLPLAVSCKNTDGGGPDATRATGEDETLRINDNLPARDYGGYEY